MSASQTPGIVASQVLADSGSAAAPTIGFNREPTSGLFWKSSGVLGISILGTEVFNFSAGGGSEVGQLELADGSIAAPSLAFASEPGLGLYRAGAADMRIVAGAATIAIFNATTVQLQNPTSVAAVSVTGRLSTARTNVASTATIPALAITSSYIKLTGSTATDLQGITAGINGQRLTLVNLTGQDLTIRNQSASAASGAKITTLTGADITTTGNGAAEFIYDTNASPAEWTCIWVTA